MRTIKDLQIKPGSRVLLRADFNVSMENGKIMDDFRISAVLPTLEHLRELKVKTFILAHLGRPSGIDASLSLQPVARHLSQLLSAEVVFCKNYNQAKKAISKLPHGGVAMYENLRFNAGEEESSRKFAEEIASLGDAYINDAFAVSHRKHASVYLLPQLIPSAAGLLLTREIEVLNEIRHSSKPPLVFVMGGAKVESKIKTFAKIFDRIDAVCLAGLIANTILHLKGIAIGKSKFEPGLERYVKSIKLTDTRIHLPVDVIVSDDASGKSPVRSAAVGDILESDMIFDIGPDTINLFINIIESAGTVIWNGPMGVFENKVFSKGTYELARALKNTQARVVVGGGDVIRAIHEVSAEDSVYYISTGGGAMLEYIADGTLPGIEVLS